MSSIAGQAWFSAAPDADASLLAGLIGRGIQGSRSPALHMQEAAAQGLRLAYLLIDLDAPPWDRATLDEAVRGAEERWGRHDTRRAQPSMRRFHGTAAEWRATCGQR